MKLFGKGKSGSVIGSSRRPHSRRLRGLPRSHSHPGITTIGRQRSGAIVEPNTTNTKFAHRKVTSLPIHSKPVSYFDAVMRGRDTGRRYEKHFENQLKHFLFLALLKEEGCMLPDEMRFDYNYIVEIKPCFLERVKSLTSNFPDDIAPSSFCLKLRAQIDQFIDISDVLLEPDISYNSIRLSKEVKTIKEQLETIKRFKNIFYGFATILRFLQEGSKKPSISPFVRSFVQDLEKEDGVFSELSACLSNIDFSKPVKKKRSDANILALKKAFFGVEKIGADGLSGIVETLLIHCEIHLKYLQALFSIKQGYVKRYFSRFQHKEIQLKIEILIEQGEKIDRREYNLLKNDANNTIRNFCDKYPSDEEGFHLLTLKVLLDAVFSDPSSGNIIEAAKIAKLDPTIFPKASSERIEVIRAANLDPRTHLLRDSYLRMLEKLAILKTMVKEDEPKPEAKESS